MVRRIGEALSSEPSPRPRGAEPRALGPPGLAASGPSGSARLASCDFHLFRNSYFASSVVLFARPRVGPVRSRPAPPLVTLSGYRTRYRFN
jgi:hypothetical protein